MGRFKAAFFARLGYWPDDWQRLEADLRSQHVAFEAEIVATTGFGTKYRVVAPLAGPLGRTAAVVAIWIVPTGQTIPRLVTLIPGDSS